MARARTSMYLDGHTYSLFDPDEIHRDLELDPARSRLVLNRSKDIAAMHEHCEQCQVILREHAAAATRDEAGGYPSLDAAILAHAERATQFVISRANLARMLHLGQGERIVRMHVDPDTQLLKVVVAGEHYPSTPDGYAVPVTRTSRTASPPDAIQEK